MRCVLRWFSLGIFFFIIVNVVCLPIGQPEAAVDVMIHVPQWHCMRYRKFELVRRCRSYKNGLRRGNTKDGDIVEAP